MPRLDYKRCRDCGQSASEVGLLSWSRLCGPCAEVRYMANLDQLRSHTGPYALHHRRQCVAAWGGVLLDDTRQSA